MWEISLWTIGDELHYVKNSWVRMGVKYQTQDAPNSNETNTSETYFVTERCFSAREGEKIRISKSDRFHQIDLADELTLFKKGDYHRSKRLSHTTIDNETTRAGESTDCYVI